VRNALSLSILISRFLITLFSIDIATAGTAFQRAVTHYDAVAALHERYTVTDEYAPDDCR